MIIHDLEYTEECEQSTTIQGGRRRRRRQQSNSSLLSLFQPFLQSLSINPAASATIANLGGNSIGNTAISTNISMPIFIVINQHGDGQIFW
ncbi:MAG: hypothetical protein MUC48_16920 [Leptolyngbya sp. Prado105]|jgi:hypothetical protein|nr:hypothetical protein [Leptolyngbya sp. Prado105]